MFKLKIKIRKTAIVPVVFVKHGLLRRLRVFENRILAQIFRPKRDENGEWRRL